MFTIYLSFTGCRGYKNNHLSGHLLDDSENLTRSFFFVKIALEFAGVSAAGVPRNRNLGEQKMARLGLHNERVLDLH